MSKMSELYIELMEFGEMQMEKLSESDDYHGLVCFEDSKRDGEYIINPFLDVTGRYEVIPETYYNEKDWKYWRDEVLKRLED